MNSLDYIYYMRNKYNQTGGKEGAFVVAINCSWGKDSLRAEDYPDWCAMYDKLGEEGILCVTSVPNDNINVDISGDMPSTCASDFLITVTNTNQYDEKALYAGYGNVSVDIGAPGDNSYTLLNTGDYGYFGGTSAAAAYVTGTIGILYSLPSDVLMEHIKQNPSEVAALIKSAIMTGTDKVPSLENITVSGGRLNTFNSLKILCDYYGLQNLYENIFEELKILSAYPNPAKSSIKIVVESNSARELNLSIININGQIFKLSKLLIYEGIQELSIGLENIPKGFYIMSISSGHELTNIKLIVQ